MSEQAAVADRAGPPVSDNREVTVALGRWVASLDLSDVPSHVLDHAKLCILDTIGCGILGSREPCGEIAKQAMHDLCPTGPSSVWGAGEKTGPAEAALVNGTAAHGFELDDIHVASVIHPGAVTVPATIAVAESRSIDGATVLVGTVAGYEAGLRLGMSAGTSHAAGGYHATGTIGCIASAAGVARTLGLDFERSLHAIAIGATQAGALYCARRGAMAKRLHAGRAAHAGVLAGFLAARGFTGARRALEDENGGFLSTMAENADPGVIVDGLGSRWETAAVGFKIYSSCASSHTTIDAIDDLMQHGLNAGNLDHLSVYMSRIGSNNVNWPYRPSDPVAAQMNGYYTAAVKLLDGETFIDQYREERLADPKILNLIPKISIAHDPALDAGGTATRHSVRVEAALRDGRHLSAKVDHRKGSVQRPIPSEDVIVKYKRLAAIVLTPTQTDDLLAEVMSLEKAKDLSRISKLLSVESRKL